VDSFFDTSPVVVKGRLRRSLNFWQSIGASSWVLNIIRLGYCLPFIEQPERKVLNNHASALKNSDFVLDEINKLLVSGALVEVEDNDIFVCSPLGVVTNTSGKSRLILDLRYINTHLRVTKFKYEDIRTASDLFQQGDWFFKFDYTSGYHHIEMFPEHTKFLGCSWVTQGRRRFFQFTVLPFGLATAPFLFTKIQKTLVKYWRGQGIRIFTYLDDGAGAEDNLVDAKETSEQVRRDIEASGFVANEEKSQWEPAQYGELLGFMLDLSSGLFSVPERRVAGFKDMLQRIVDCGFVTSARQLARITGCLSSMGLALGAVVRLWTRELYRTIQQSSRWDEKFALADEAKQEIIFWQENFDNSGQPIWRASPKIEVLSYSDASDVAWGGYAVQLGDNKAVGSWSTEESTKSSTFRELKAARLVLESLVSQLEGKEVKHRTDNQGTERIMTVGSRNPELHREAILIYKLCRLHNIRLTVEWVSRDQNITADSLSRLDDPDDYMLDPECFHIIDQLWGPHTHDRFASLKTKQLPRFSSRYLNPGCEVMDAFTVSWSNENNWIFPPPYLIPRVIGHMRAGKESGTLLIPYWPSAPWWPLLISKDNSWKSFVKSSLNLPTYNGIFIPGSAASNIFTAGVPPFQLRALRVEFN
jgi:hypothetical protein